MPGDSVPLAPGEVLEALDLRLLAWEANDTACHALPLEVFAAAGNEAG